MPTGTGAVNLRNLPVTKYTINPVLFNQLTSKVVFDPINFPLPGFGNYYQNQLLQVGIIGSLRVVITGTVTTTGATVTIAPTVRWPWDLISVQISGNGQNNFINAQGSDLRLRQLSSARGYVDTISSYPYNASASPFNTAGSANFTLVYKIPIAMDDTTLVGALYAQSEATNLAYRFQTGNLSDLFNVTAGTLAISGTIFLEEEIFEVPYDPQHPDTLIIPDLTVLHGFVANDTAVASQSVLETQLFRINGQLERLFFYTVDKSTANIAFTQTSTYNSAQVLYGSNQTPYSWNPMTLKKLIDNYNYRQPLGAALTSQGNSPAASAVDGVYCLDLVADNPARDQVLLEGVTNLRLRTTYVAAPTGGSYVHTVQETLFA
jgi:uncharacterized membrane protein